MILLKQSKHNIHNISNTYKLNVLDKIFMDFEELVKLYMNMVFEGKLPLKTNLSSKLLPELNDITHSKWKREAYKKASILINSDYKKSTNKRYNTYKKVYKYFIENNRQNAFINKRFSQLKLNNIVTSKYMIKPNLKNLSIELGKEFINIKKGVFFDNFIKITTPYIPLGKSRAETINIPLKHHRHSLKLINNGYTFKGSILLKNIKNNYFIHLNMEKIIDLKPLNKINPLGIDLGVKKLISTSRKEYIGKELESFYKVINNKKQGSKKFKKSLIHRDNLIRYYCNQLDLKNINLVCVEDLKNVKLDKKGFTKKHKNAINNLQRWRYQLALTTIKGRCNDLCITVIEVQPHYTSQTCSKCHNIDKKSRSGENYHCVNCGYEIDADYNASLNIMDKGLYSVFTQQKYKICKNV